MTQNPSEDYLQARGYINTAQAIQTSGPWNAIGGTQGPIEQLNYPAMGTPFVDVDQCAFLNYSLTYYLDSNRG